MSNDIEGLKSPLIPNFAMEYKQVGHVYLFPQRKMVWNLQDVKTNSQNWAQFAQKEREINPI